MIERIVPIPAFEDNYIWALISDDSRCTVVDPGDPAPVIDFLQQQSLSLDSILITHHHPDHTGGLAKLEQLYGVNVIGPDSAKIEGIKTLVRQGDTIEVLGIEFAVLEVPGHTLDHIAFFSEQQDSPLLFCGDTLFALGCGRLFEGDPAMMNDSLGKLAELPGTTAVYCTHEYTLANLRFALAVDPGNEALQTRAEEERSKREQALPTLPSTISRELRTNPFLRCDNSDVRASVEKQTGQNLSSTVEVFAGLRHWKDQF